MNKRGLSQVVTTIILILLILVAVALVWFAVDRFILQGTQGLNFEKFTLDLKIQYAVVDFDTGIVTVRVVRNPGEGNLTGIKFVVEDDRSSEVYDEPVENFLELVERTFELNISERPELTLEEVEKISIAPLYISGTSDLETLGSIADSVDNLNKGINSTLGDDEEPPVPVCEIDSDCGSDFWINGSEICSQDAGTVLQYKKIFNCELGFCSSISQTFVKQTCISGETCYAGVCVLDIESCNVESDCGTDEYVGLPRCAIFGEFVVQDYRNYSCTNEICNAADSEIVLEECVLGDICNNGECFTPLECVQNNDCDLCEICEEGICVTEIVMNEGIIRSAWPYGIGEYFDSFDLPDLAGSELIGKYINFPGSSQAGCLILRDHVVPPENTTGLIAYARLNNSETLIADNDNYEIWETACMC